MLQGMSLAAHIDIRNCPAVGFLRFLKFLFCQGMSQLKLNQHLLVYLGLMGWRARSFSQAQIRCRRVAPIQITPSVSRRTSAATAKTLGPGGFF
jgi:hypothetical protein